MQGDRLSEPSGPTDSAAGFQPGYIARIRRYRAMSGHALTMA